MFIEMIFASGNADAIKKAERTPQLNEAKAKRIAKMYGVWEEQTPEYKTVANELRLLISDNYRLSVYKVEDGDILDNITNSELKSEFVNKNSIDKYQSRIEYLYTRLEDEFGGADRYGFAKCDGCIVDKRKSRFAFDY